jgi:hypothetical protein
MRTLLFLQKSGFWKNPIKLYFEKKVQKLGFLTELWNTLKNSQFKICEIGVDTTCKQLFQIKINIFIYFLNYLKTSYLIIKYYVYLTQNVIKILHILFMNTQFLFFL